MEENKNQESFIGKALEYDYTKSVTVDINVAYIEALQRITRFFLTEVIEDLETVPEMFAKFNKIIQDKKVTEETKLSEIDKMIYTLYTLQLELNQKAKDLGYVKEVERKSSKDEMLKNLDELVKKIDPSDNDVDMKRVEQLYSLLNKK